MPPREVSEDIVDLFSKNKQNNPQTTHALLAIPNDMTISQFLAQSNAATIDTTLSINLPLTFKLEGKTIEGLEPAARTIALLQEQAKSTPYASAFDTLISSAQKAHEIEQIQEVTALFGGGRQTRIYGDGTKHSEHLDRMVVFLSGSHKSSDGDTLFSRIHKETEGIESLNLVKFEAIIRQASPQGTALQDSIIIATAQNLVQRFSALDKKGADHFTFDNLGEAVNSCLRETKQAIGTATPFIQAAINAGVSNPDLLTKLVTKAQSLTGSLPKELQQEMRAEMKSIFQEADIKVPTVKLGIMERLAQMLPFIPRSPQTSAKLMVVELQKEMKKEAAISFGHNTQGGYPAGRAVSIDFGIPGERLGSQSPSQGVQLQVITPSMRSESMHSGAHSDFQEKQVAQKSPGARP